MKTKHNGFETIVFFFFVVLKRCIFLLFVVYLKKKGGQRKFTGLLMCFGCCVFQLLQMNCCFECGIFFPSMSPWHSNKREVFYLSLSLSLSFFFPFVKKNCITVSRAC